MPYITIGYLKCGSCGFDHKLEMWDPAMPLDIEATREHMKTDTNTMGTLSEQTDGQVVWGIFCKKCESVTAAIRKKRLLLGYKFIAQEVVDTSDWSESDWEKFEPATHAYLKWTVRKWE